MDTIDDIVDEEDEDDTEDEDRDEKDDPPLPASDDSLPSYGLFVCLSIWLFLYLKSIFQIIQTCSY